MRVIAVAIFTCSFICYAGEQFKDCEQYEEDCTVQCPTQFQLEKFQECPEEYIYMEPYPNNPEEGIDENLEVA